MITKFVYLAQQEIPVMVIAKRRPSEKTIPKYGTWPIQELTQAPDGITSNWRTVGEVTWGVLSKLTYVGKVSIADAVK